MNPVLIGLGAWLAGAPLAALAIGRFMRVGDRCTGGRP